MGNKEIFRFRSDRKISFDGDSHLVRLPVKIIRFLEEHGWETGDVYFDGIQKRKDGRAAVVMEFDKKKVRKRR